MAMLVSLTSFAAALGEGYSKVTDITTLSAGDKVVLYCDDAGKGVTGWDGNKTATAAAEGWVEYVVEAAEGGVLLKDGEQYIALTAKNGFYYTATGSVCKVTADGVLYITLSGADYLLYENANNGSPLYRMYVDKTGNAQYKPVYVYEVVVAEEGGESEGEGETATVPTNAELWEAFKPYYNTFYGEARSDQPITAVATFMTKGEKLLTDATSEYKWLGDYLLKVTNEQIADGTLKTYTGITTEVKWRFATQAFFNCSAAKDADYSGNADFTEAGKPENWGPYYLAAQEGTTPEPEPTTETVYFVNAANWAKVNAYAWTTDPIVAWPGAAATLEAEQIAGYEVYSYTLEAGAAANVIFNNGSGQQTADLVWTAGKYYVKDGWYTKEEAETKLAAPVEYESVYFVDNQGWGKANIYTWTPEVGTWPGVAMTKEAEQLAGYDVYSYTVEKGTSFGGVIFNNGSGVQTGDLKWTAGKYYVKDAWYTKEEAEAKLAGPVTPPVITYVLMGVAGDWTTGIALTVNPDNANEYVLLGQEIAEGDAVKVVTLTDGTATAWCGNVDEYSVAHTADDMGNIVLAPGKYDFYYKVAEDIIYIGGEAYPVEPEYELMELTMTNLEIQSYGAATGLWASDEENGIEVMLFLDAEGNLMEESSIVVGWADYAVTGTVTKVYNEELATDVYTAELYTTVGETNYKLIITMYAVPVEVVEVVVEDATITVEELPDGVGGTYESINVSAQWGESTLLIEGIEKNFEGFVMITEKFMVDGEEDWYIWMGQNATVTTVDNVLTVAGEFKNNFTGSIYNVTISGTLPTTEEPEVEKPEPVYEDNNLNPYAFGLESKLSDDKSTLTMTYRLNNSKATDVDVVVKGGDEVIIVVNGTTNMGKNTVEISTEGFPGGVDITWSVIVTGTSVETPTQETKMYSMYCPHGLAIDKDPESENFGRILVADAMQLVKDKSGYLGSGIGAGLHAFNPSFTTDSTVYTGGNDFTRIWADNGYQPWRVKISEDGRIFVSSLDLNGVVVWEVSKDLQTWTPVIAGTQGEDGNIYDADGNFVAGMNVSMDVKGSGEDLTLLLYSCTTKAAAFSQAAFRLDEYALGTATTWTGTPKNILTGGKYALVHTNAEWIYDGEGGYWFGGSRAGNAGQANLAHINAEGVEDYRSEDASLYGGDGVLLHDGMLIKGKARTSTSVGNIGFWTVSKDENGAPVLTEKWVVAANGIGRNLNEFAVDYANNLYAVGNSGEKIIAYALPYSGEVETPAASKYAFQLESTGSDYEMYEDAITNLVIDYDNMLLIGGPSANFQVEVVLGLGDYDRNTDNFALLPESSISVLGSEATFVEGWASVDGIAQTASAVVRCLWNEMALELHLTMSAAPLEATVVVVENAAIEIEKYLLWGDMYDYALKMTGVWHNEEDGLDYPVLVEVPVYYPESTEPYEIYSTVTVGGWGDEDPWLGFGEGYLTITPEGQKITAAGIVENPMAGIAIDITISGTITPTGLENATVTVKSVKMIKNGQLVIEKDGVQYNANGAILK